MSEITAIKPQLHDATRCNIEVDGRFLCGMKLETVVQNRLKVGAEVSMEELARIQYESEKQTALDKALSHISASMKTEREIRAFLTRKGFLGDVADYVVEKMKEYGFLDDGEYARRYAESAGSRKGKRLIAAELRAKGASKEAVENALEGIDEEAAAEAVLEKYLRGKNADDPSTYRKAYSYLISRGFGYETVRSALSRLPSSED